MLKNLLIISSFILISFTSFAGENATTTIKGSVVDKEDQEVLTGVKISIKELNQDFYSDFDGNFKVPNLDNNSTYTITISYISYEDQILTDVSPADIHKKLAIALVKE